MARSMFLKSLTLRGFKSFPDKTTLVFEPGVTVIVGPNGSGKSNLTDSVSWVLGEQGPRSLRGGKMEDVIFAGSPGRPALGMAEVTLTIDNSAGLLPIEFSEVTIARTLFRSGDSEYRLNGQACRLLDIQEVLSDTGIGREQHTIISQGQLEEILQSDPSQMRSFIEEAAGVAKHRRRKDRALRKIASTEQNLARLSDLLSELRRQLRPLREQAEVAKRHAALAEELGRVRLVQSARELAALHDRVGRGAGPAEDPVRDKEAELTELEGRLYELEGKRSDLFAKAERARDAAWGLSRSQDRLSGLARLAVERSRGLRAELAVTTEEAASARMAHLERESSEARGEIEAARAEEARVGAAAGERESEARAAREALDRIGDALEELRAARREHSTAAGRIRGEMAAIEDSLTAARSEAARVEARERESAEARAEAATRLEEAREETARLESEEEPLGRQLEEIEEEIRRLEAQRSSSERTLREMDRKAALWRARADVHSAEPAALRIAGSGIPGVAGILADLVEARVAYRKALDAVAGPASGVLVLTGTSALRRVLSELSEGEGIGCVISSDEHPQVPGAARLSDLITCSPEARAALGDVFVVDDIAEAVSLAEKNRGAIFVTPGGAFASGSIVARGPADAAERAAEMEAQLRIAESETAEIDRRLRHARSGRQSISARLNEIDAALAAQVERLTHCDRDLHALDRELGAIGELKVQTEQTVVVLDERIAALSARLPDSDGKLTAAEADIARLEQEHGLAHGAYQSASRAWEEARLAAARVSERLRLVEERLQAVVSEIAGAEDLARGIEARRTDIHASITKIEEIASAAGASAEAASGWAASAEADYQSFREDLRSTDSEISETRTERAGLAGALEDLRERVRREEAGRSELKVRAMMIEERMREEWEIEPVKAVSRYGHVWEVEEPSAVTDPLERVALLDDEALRRKRVRLEQEVERVGQVNPLAAQEFEALQEREAFLGSQMDDVRRSRRDLLKVVASVDDRIKEIFLGAFEDVAREYERLFSLLFPGGQGRMKLTDPSDPLETGVEVEARPGGKNLKRLSLLSGGEKALSALAILFAIFRARPSPFYVLDEVEAALDDVNLHRFLQLLLDFRATSQLLVVTHQKRTMEIADVLYGVSIRPDGASRVISQRVGMPPQDGRPAPRAFTES